MDYSITGITKKMTPKNIEKIQIFLSYSIDQYIRDYFRYQMKYKGTYKIYVTSFDINDKKIIMEAVLIPNFPEIVSGLRATLNNYVLADQGNISIGDYTEVNVTNITFRKI